MKAELHESSLERYEMVYEGQKTMEITGESVVSDKMPDIGLLGDTRAYVLLRSKRTETGAAIMEGDLSIEVCYIPDGAAGFCVLNMQLPWIAEYQSDKISGEHTAIGTVQVVHLETRMLNPRKILVKAKLEGNMRVFSLKKSFLCDDIKDDETIQVRREELTCSVISTVCEKTFAATDEYPMPAGLNGSEVIGKSVQFRVDDIKTLMNKLIVKGCVLSDVVICSEEGETERINFTSAFSFIAETDCDTLSDEVRIDIMPTAMYYELSSNGRTLSVEVHGVCQMTVYGKREIKYLSDSYSNFYLCQCDYDDLMVYRDMKIESHREKLSGSITCRSQLSCVRFLTASYTLGEAQINIRVGACIEYENGSLDWVRKQTVMPVQLKDGECLSEVRLNDFHSGCSGAELEYRMNVEWDTVCEERVTIKHLVSVECDEDMPLPQRDSSLILARWEGSLWELARKLKSTVQLIQTYNELESDEVSRDTLLLIPRQRKK